MPFGNMTLAGDSFEPRGTGRYVLATAVWPGPMSYLDVGLLTQRKTKDGVELLTISNVVAIQKNVTMPSGAVIVQELQARLTLNFTSAFTAADLDKAVLIHSDFASESRFNRQIQREQ